MKNVPKKSVITEALQPTGEGFFTVVSKGAGPAQVYVIKDMEGNEISELTFRGEEGKRAACCLAEALRMGWDALYIQKAES